MTVYLAPDTVIIYLDHNIVTVYLAPDTEIVY